MIREEIFQYLIDNSNQSSAQIFSGLNEQWSYATVKRVLSILLNEKFIDKEGKAKATKYNLSKLGHLHFPVQIDKYFEKEQDDRKIKSQTDFLDLIKVLKTDNIFDVREIDTLEKLHKKFKANILSLSKTIYEKEMERLAIDLSWKSSQIEGNTYSLLETELLLKEKITAAGKPKDDATMLLNHKEAINFVVENPGYLNPLTISGIEDIHTLLIKDLKVDRNIRKRKVGISGTNYTPMDNEFQIREAMQNMSDLVNSKTNIHAKSFLTLILISYLQPFADGNKRTARIVSNSFLLNSGYCPISYRTVDSIEYKKAMLIFYEQNNLSAIKKIFIDQYAFAVNTYF